MRGVRELWLVVTSCCRADDDLGTQHCIQSSQAVVIQQNWSLPKVKHVLQTSCRNWAVFVNTSRFWRYQSFQINPRDNNSCSAIKLHYIVSFIEGFTTSDYSHCTAIVINWMATTVIFIRTDALISATIFQKFCRSGFSYNQHRLPNWAALMFQMKQHRLSDPWAQTPLVYSTDVPHWAAQAF